MTLQTNKVTYIKPFQIENNILELDNFRKYKYINCQNCTIIKINNIFGGNIVEINCSNNQIKNFDGLPFKVYKLQCSHNKLINLDCLPKKLKYLDCSHNKNITQLNNLPFELEYLDCKNCNISNLDYLPEKLKHLNCSYNNIRELLNLPLGLEVLICSGCEILNFYYIPKNIKRFSCSANYKANFNFNNINLEHFECNFCDIHKIIDILPKSVISIKLSNFIDSNKIIDLNKFEELKNIELISGVLNEIIFSKNIIDIKITNTKLKKIYFNNSLPKNINFEKTIVIDGFSELFPDSIENLILNYSKNIKLNNIPLNLIKISCIKTNITIPEKFKN